MRSDRLDPEPMWENNARYLSALEAAAVLGTNRRAIRTLVARGQLEKRKTGTPSGLEISTASVKRLQSERRQVQQASPSREQRRDEVEATDKPLRKGNA